MIRVDEIYNNTFWPWIRANKSNTRMLFCDPPGVTDPSALFNYGRDDVIETDYVFFHDQEPIHLDSFAPLFQEVINLNLDVYSTAHYNNRVPALEAIWKQHKKFSVESILQCQPQLFGHVVVSELGEQNTKLTDTYGWKSHYYFYHGWACQDWYRGYDKTFLIPRARDRKPQKTFMSPNRIVGGKRDHRVIFLYHVFKQQLEQMQQLLLQTEQLE